jgi:hypothetical protein
MKMTCINSPGPGPQTAGQRDERINLIGTSSQTTRGKLQTLTAYPPAPGKTAKPRAGARDTAPRAWQRMLSGRRLDLLDPSPLDIEIEDIAHGLARVARWNGQTRGDHIFSVAQHTLLTAEIARRRTGSGDRRLGLAAMLHDAPEYVIGDMISPFKAVIGGSYKEVECRLLAAIHLRFGLPPALPGFWRRRRLQASTPPKRGGFSVPAQPCRQPSSRII